MAAPPPRTTVLLKRFPKLSETFINGEIVSLIEAGHDLSIASMWPPRDEPRQPASEAIMHRVVYLSAQSLLAGVIGLAGALARRPLALVSVFQLCWEVPCCLGLLARLVAHCHRDGTRHIHCHYLSEPAALAAAAADVLGISFSISAHAKDIYETDPKVAARRISRSTFVTTCTRHNHEYLCRLAPTLERVNLVYHGIDAEFFVPPSDAASDAQHRIVTVGRFKRKKGFDVLIRACASLIARGIKLECKIVGYGEEESRLRSLIEQLGVESHVELVPPMTHGRLRELLQSASVFVLPCRVMASGDRDGIPNSLLEAMSAGLPVVSTDVSGIPEVLENRANGILIQPDDPAALSEALRELFDDPTLCRRLAKAGRQTVIEQFSWRTNVSRLCTLLSTPRPQTREAV